MGRNFEMNKCIDCGVETKGYGKRCYSCSKKGKLNHLYNPKIHKKHYCKKCDGEISITSALYGSRLCNSCARKNKNNHNFGKHFSKEHKTKISEAQKLERHWNWQGGISFEPYPLGWNKTFKEQIRYRDGYKCQLCGKPEIEQGYKLHVHHIDYDKQNIMPYNLISLCNSCHMKTNYNRDYWFAYFTYIMENYYVY